MLAWFNSKRLLIVIVFLFGAFIPACGNGGIDASHFYDNFEDNDLTSPSPGWAIGNGSYGNLGIEAIPDGNLVLSLLGGGSYNQPYWRTGLSHRLGDLGVGITPNYVAFTVSPCIPPNAWGDLGFFSNFELAGSLSSIDPITNVEGIHMYFEYDPAADTYTMIVNGVEIMKRDLCHLYTIEIKHIDWAQDPPVFDFFVNGQMEAACLPFSNPLTDFTYLHLYNVHWGYTKWDEILMRAYESQEGWTACPYRAPLPPPPTQPPTKEPRRPRLIRDTFCWFGPGGDRFEVVNSLAEGLDVDLIGKGDVPGWYIIDSPGFPGAPCWVDENDLDEIAPDLIPLLVEFKTPVIVRETKPPPSSDDDENCEPGAPCP